MPKLEAALKILIVALSLLLVFGWDVHESRFFFALSLAALFISFIPGEWLSQCQNPEARVILRKAKALLIVLFALTMLVFSGWWKYYREVTKYYTKYFTEIDQVNGLFEIPESQAQVRRAYAITYRNGKAVRVRILQPLKSKIIINPSELFTTYTKELSFSYYPNGKLSGKGVYDQYGRSMYASKYTADSMIVDNILSFEQDSVPITNKSKCLEYAFSTLWRGANINIFEGLFFSRLDATHPRQLLENNEDGFSKYNNMDHYTRTTEDYRGVSGYKYLQNALGLLSRRTNVDSSGKTVSDRYGVASCTYEYDEFGNTVKRVYRDKNGDLREDEYGVAVIEEKYNKDGNIEERWFKNSRNEKCFLHFRFHKIVFKYDNSKNMTDVRFYNIDGETPCFTTERIHHIHYEYDEKNRHKSISFRSMDNIPTSDNYGIHKYKILYNGDNTVRRIDCLPLGESGFSQSGKPIIPSLSIQYDKDKRIKKMLFHGRNGYPVMHPTLGYAGIAVEHEGKNAIDVTLLDISENPVSSPEGFCKMRVSYDPKNFTYTLRYYPSVEAKTPKKIKAGYAMKKMIVDPISGHPSSITVEDELGNLCRDENGVYRVSFFSKGDVVICEIISGDIEGEKRKRIQCQYDRYMRPMEIRYLAAKGDELVASQSGIAVIEHEYKDIFPYRYNEERYLDANRQPCNDVTGLSKTIKVHDHLGNLVHIRMLTVKGDDYEPPLTGEALVFFPLMAGSQEREVSSLPEPLTSLNGNHILSLGTYDIEKDPTENFFVVLNMSNIYYEYDKAGNKTMMRTMNSKGQSIKWYLGENPHAELVDTQRGVITEGIVKKVDITVTH